MERLPTEIIEKILACSRISIQDVVNFAMTCHHFNDIVMNSNLIWKGIFFQKWGRLRDLENKYVFYPSEVKYLYELKQRCLLMLEKMSLKFKRKSHFADCEIPEWLALISEREETYSYLVLILMEIVHNDVPIKSIKPVPYSTPGHKTIIYYALKVLRHIRQLHLETVWKNYSSLPQSLQLLEIGACIISQWCQPAVEVYVEDVSHQLDEIADIVRDVLRSSHPKHSLLSAQHQDLVKWRNETITKNQWDAKESRQLIDVLRLVMFQQMGFVGDSDDYYNLKNSCIDQVLVRRQGLPITLAIIFEGVARRLGLRCDPISFPAHFLLRFSESSDPESDRYYIDVFDGGHVVNRGACPHSKWPASRMLFPVATPDQIMERMANNVEVSSRQHGNPNDKITRMRSALELIRMITPTDISALEGLAKIYMTYKMNTESLENFLSSQQFEAPEQAHKIVRILRVANEYYGRRDLLPIHSDVAAPRRPGTLYAVGMVVRHSNTPCVVYDWDPVFTDTPNNWEYLKEDITGNVRYKENQPYYKLLTPDNGHRYAAQETLSPATDADLGAFHNNEDIGRHFSHSFETHFVPNIDKDREYPEDQEVRERYHHHRKLQDIKL